MTSSIAVLLGIRGRGEAERGRRRDLALGPLGDLLGPDAGERHEDDEVLALGQRVGQPPSASVLPAREAPTIVTREPLPTGVSHSIAFTVGSSEPS